MRKSGKAFLSLLLSAVILSSQPVLAADFSDGEGVFSSGETGYEAEAVPEAPIVFEEAGDAAKTKEYEATGSHETCDLGQYPEAYKPEDVYFTYRIENTGTKSWHIKSVSDMKYFDLYRKSGIQMEKGSKIEPGEYAITGFRPIENLRPGFYKEIFTVETEEGIQIKCPVQIRIGGGSDKDYEVICEPENGTSVPTITQKEYDEWDDVEPDPDIWPIPCREIKITNNGQKPIDVKGRELKYFYGGGVNTKLLPGESETVEIRPKAEEQVVTETLKISITGGIELSYIISQNCPHISPDYPGQTQIKNVSVQGAAVKAVVYDCENSEGYDAVLTKEKWSERPENYIKTVKNQDAKTITFTNVKNGTYYLGVHAYNRDYYDGKVSEKRFGKWSLPKKVVVKNGIPTEIPKIKAVKTDKNRVAVTVGVPQSYEKVDIVLESTNKANVYKRSNRTTYTRLAGVKPGTYTLKVRPWLKINGKKTYGDWVSWPKKIRVK